MELMRSFWSATWLHLVHRIVTDQQVNATSFQVFLSEKLPAQEYRTFAEMTPKFEEQLLLHP